MYYGEMMRAMVMGCVWDGGWSKSRSMGWRRTSRSVPMALLPPVFLGLAVAGAVAVSLGIALVATAAALLFAFAVVGGVFGALGFVTWQVLRRSVPGLHRRRGAAKPDMRTRRQEETSFIAAETPLDLLRRRYATGEIGQTAFRRQLTDLLKERYVRGDLTLAEFENRVRHVYSDPALTPPA